MHVAVGAFQTDDQHVLGEPALLTCLVAGDAQSVTFLAQQRVTTVTRADALDAEFVRKMHYQAPFGIEIARRMQAFDKTPFRFNACQCLVAHACHEFHIDNDIRAIRDFDSAAGVG